LDEGKQRDVLAIVATSGSRRAAANYVCCDTRTIRNTAERNTVFAEKLAKAETSAEVMHVNNINAAAKEPRYWRASAWVLERMRPESYGIRDPKIVTPEQFAEVIDQITTIIVAEVPVERYQKNIQKKLDELIKNLVEK
jgi:hypothetical protein